MPRWWWATQVGPLDAALDCYITPSLLLMGLVGMLCIILLEHWPWVGGS